mgnify:FL=1
MNEQIKLLLMSYIDGDCSERESMEAEAIIKSDPVALDFTNSLKQANIEIDTFYKSQDNEEMEDRLYQFVVQEILKKNAYKFNFIEKLFSLRPVLNYSLTALFFLSVGIFYDDYMFEMDFEEESQIEVLSQPSSEKVTLLTLSSELHEKQVLKTRGLETENNSLKSYIKETIQEMLEVNTSEGVLKYGSENVAIFLEEKTIEKDLLTCYSGSIFTNGFKSNILFCTSPNDTSLIYTN